MPGIFKENEILFVCDVGGGTTDLSVFRVINTIGGSLSLKQLGVIFGATIGAAQLDSLVENVVLERLQLADRSIPTGFQDLNSAAWEIRISKEYQNAKCDYGFEESLADTDTFALRVPKLDPSYSNPQYEISGGDMYFQRDDLKGNFDEQIAKLFEMVDKQLIRLQQKHPNKQVAHLVLSSGLGNSVYMQSCLRSRYAFGNSTHSNARSIQYVWLQIHSSLFAKETLPTKLQNSGVGNQHWAGVAVAHRTAQSARCYTTPTTKTTSVNGPK